MSDLPLSGVRVIDLTRAVAGPYCTMLLGDFGAEVIKLETPFGGDIMRNWPPTFGGESASFISVNRNKKSVTANIKNPKGLQILKELIALADILILNFTPKTIKKIGLSYSEVAEINPRIIYCLISGYGESGPNENRPAYDYMIQGESGLMHMTGEPDRPPVRCGIGIADISAGLYSTIAILTALRLRDKEGKGLKIGISLLDSTIAIQSYLAQKTLFTGESPARTGLAHPNGGSLYTAYYTKDDKLLIIYAYEDEYWKSLCNVLSLGTLVDDPRFSTYKKRRSKESERDLSALLEINFKKWTCDELLENLIKAGIPCGPVRPLDQTLADPQVIANNMVVTMEHPSLGKIRVLNNPIK